MASNEVARSLTTSFGATLLGTFFSAMYVLPLHRYWTCPYSTTHRMYGLTVYQTYRYYRQYTIDRWSLKALVRHRNVEEDEHY